MPISKSYCRPDPAFSRAGCADFLASPTLIWVQLSILKNCQANYGQPALSLMNNPLIAHAVSAA